MGRPRKSRTLTVWMNGERVGDWRQPSGRGQEFLYAESWLASPAARPISLSLPLRPSTQPYREGVEAFFDNLLPDNRQIRERIQRRFRTASTAAFDLLAEIGRDCVGALQLLPEAENPPDVRRITSQALSRDGVAGLLRRSLGEQSEDETGANDTFRISLAGAQEKTALLRREGGWHRPTGATPTTHILKLPLGTNAQGIDLSTSVENEWLCAEVVRAFGVPVADASIETFGDFRVLVVERFDRRLSPDGRWYVRLPQEDLCQATRTPPGLKYESDGGPGIEMVMQLLLGSEQPEVDRRTFLHLQLIYWLLAAIDGHAKNFSIFLFPGGGYRLTPAYDVLSAHPMLGHGWGRLDPGKIRMAMAVRGRNRHYRWSEFQAHHWLETARRCGFGGMRELMEEVVARTPAAIQQVRGRIPAGFPPALADAILKGIEDSAGELARQLAQPQTA